jgi:hypothetical protein
MAVTFFCSRFLVVHISPTRTGEFNSHHLQSPMRWKVCIRRGAACCPEGTVCDTAVTNSVPCCPRHDASRLGFGGPQPCLPSKDVIPLRYKDPYDCILKGVEYVTEGTEI